MSSIMKQIHAGLQATGCPQIILICVTLIWPGKALMSRRPRVVVLGLMFGMPKLSSQGHSAQIGIFGHVILSDAEYPKTKVSLYWSAWNIRFQYLSHLRWMVKGGARLKRLDMGAIKHQ